MDTQAAVFSEDAIVQIIEQRLPELKKDCDVQGAEKIIIDHLALGNTEEELFLLAIAIKYAGLIAGKTVIVTH